MPSSACKKKKRTVVVDRDSQIAVVVMADDVDGLVKAHFIRHEVGDAALELLFFFNDTATTEIYTLSLHYALPIYRIDVVVHPQSIVHSFVEFVDGSVLAQ